MTNHLTMATISRCCATASPAGASTSSISTPPLNSNASYNVLFRGHSGNQSAAQVEAFDDTWHWTDAAEMLRGRSPSPFLAPALARVLP